MRDHKLSSLGNLLGGALSRHGIGERVLAAQIVATANELLAELLPALERGSSQVISYKQQELIVACRTPTARYAVEGLARALGRKLEEVYPAQSFKKIRAVLRSGKPSEDEWYNTEEL